MPLPYYLARAVEWRAVAEALGDAGVPLGHPLLAVWREAAWCHLLETRGTPARTHLRRVVRDVTGTPPPPGADPPALFALLRSAATAAFPPTPAPGDPSCVPPSPCPPVSCRTRR